HRVRAHLYQELLAGPGGGAASRRDAGPPRRALPHPEALRSAPGRPPAAYVWTLARAHRDRQAHLGEGRLPPRVPPLGARTRGPLMARRPGINRSRMWLPVFGIGGGLAGLAGALAGPMRGAYAEMGVTMVIESFVVVVVGGMGSLLGAVVAGIMMGQVVGLTT